MEADDDLDFDWDWAEARLPPLFDELEELLRLPPLEFEVFFCVEAIQELLLFYDAAGVSSGSTKQPMRDTRPTTQQ